MKAILIIIILLGGIYLLFMGGETWQGVYYPDGCLVCESDYIFSPEFASEEECYYWGIGIQSQRTRDGIRAARDTFECGRNCKWEGGLMICSETFDY